MIEQIQEFVTDKASALTNQVEKIPVQRMHYQQLWLLY